MVVNYTRFLRDETRITSKPERVRKNEKWAGKEKEKEMKKRKVMGLLLAALMGVLITTPVLAVGENDFEGSGGENLYEAEQPGLEAITPASGTCGENLTWSLDENGTVRISGNGPMTDYEYGAQSPFGADKGKQNTMGIKEVIFEEGVTHIGKLAFSKLESLESIQLSTTVTSISSSAFVRSGLKGSLTIPGNVLSIGINAFGGCNNLTTVVLEEGVQEIGDMAFANNPMLTSVTIPASVTIIGNSIVPRGQDAVKYYGHEITIYGEAGSAAQAFAEENGNPFVAVVKMPFVDVAEDDPYYGEIEDVFKRGLMTGMSENYFGLDEEMNRAFMAAVMYRRAGYPETSFEPVFPDVKEDDWFAASAIWARYTDNIYGYENGNFGATDALTREQLCTILWRYAVTTDGADNTARADLSDSPDVDKITDFAQEAVSWCVAEGIFESRDGRLAAWENATRGEFAVMLSRYLKAVGADR